MVLKENFHPSLSIEVEPPRIHSRNLEQTEISHFKSSIQKVAPLVDMISVTNRPTFRMSSISTMKLIQSVLRDSRQASTTLPVQHLTTRLSAYDTYNELLDAKRLGIEYLLPVLGDPRGPKGVGFFKDSLDLLAFIKGVSNHEYYSSFSGYTSSLMETNASYIDDADFNVGSVIDPNAERQTRTNKWKNIREKQIELFEKRKKFGATFFITQAIFDPLQALEFLDEVDSRGVTIGIGVIPPTLTIANIIGVRLPQEIVDKFKNLHSKTQQFKLAVQLAHENYQFLRDNGVQWIHVYGLGRPEVFLSITQGDQYNAEHLAEFSIKSSEVTRN